MFLTLSVYDAARNFRGTARIRLDWGQNAWFLEGDDQQVRQHVGFSTQGAFEMKEWGVIWLWDQGHHVAIFWDAPTSDADASRGSGMARIFDPQDPAFQEGEISWTAEIAVAAQPGGVLQPMGLSERRRKVLEDLLPQVIPSAYGSDKFDLLTGGLKKTHPAVLEAEAKGRHYTTCGSLPAFVARGLGGTGKIASGGTDGLRQACYLQHVGVILDASGSQWKTADAGQGDGWAAHEVVREYNEQDGTLTGEITTGRVRDIKLLAGWVDIDKYPFPS